MQIEVSTLAETLPKLVGLEANEDNLFWIRWNGILINEDWLLISEISLLILSKVTTYLSSKRKKDPLLTPFLITHFGDGLALKLFSKEFILILQKWRYEFSISKIYVEMLHSRQGQICQPLAVHHPILTAQNLRTRSSTASSFCSLQSAWWNGVSS